MKKSFYILFLVIIVSSCDLLSTRDPEDPNASSSSFIPATSPDILFNNLKKSLSEKVVENYLACFSDPATLDISFVFISAPGSYARYPGLFNWDLNSERIYFQNMVSTAENNPIQLNLTNELNNTYGDSATFFYDYSLSFNDEIYSGSAEFTIHQDNRSQWFITTWKDFEKTESASWSELKGKYN